jgi:nucleoside-diphosphate-sugar epimerase
MRIAITGGNGLVGREIVRRALLHGHQPVVIDWVGPREPLPEGVEFRQATITDYQVLEDAFRGCDAIIHMAAYPSPGDRPDYETHNNNVVGSYNALSAAARLGIKRVCQASSINAVGAAYSRQPRFDYFPLDEEHPTYNEDPYSLSKWICEAQADSFARRYEDMTIASMRFHWVTTEELKNQASANSNPYERGQRDLWAYTNITAAAEACLLSVTVDFSGHEVFYITAPETIYDTPSRDLAAKFYPDAEIRGDFAGSHGFYNCSKAQRILGWVHNDYI